MNWLVIIYFKKAEKKLSASREEFTPKKASYKTCYFFFSLQAYFRM